MPYDDADYREIIDEFVDRVEAELGRLFSLAEQEDFAELAVLAHWFKGTSGSAGFQQFTIPAARLERAAKASDVAGVAAALDQLETLIKRVLHGALCS